MKKLINMLLAAALLLTAAGCRKKPEKPEIVQSQERTYEFESEDPGDTAGLPESIVFEGRTYQLVDLNDVSLSTLGYSDYLQKEIVVTLEDPSELQDTLTISSEQDGRLLKLYEKKLNYQEVTLTRTFEVSHTGLTGNVSSKDIDQQIEVEVMINGQPEKRTAQLQKFEKVSDNYRINDVVINAVFEGEKDTRYFEVPGDKEIAIDQDKPVWPDYQKDILKERKMSAAYYQITDGRWSDKYHEEKGRYVRHAVYTGSRLAADYLAVYAVSYNTMGYQGKAIYRTEAKPSDDSSEVKRVYRIKAIVTYRLVKSE